MKLIRLVTSNSNAYFDNTFNEDILLKPNSKIALQSTSFETQNNIIIIDSTNDEIDFEYSTGYSIKIFLNHGQYTSLNYTNLFTDIKNKFNNLVGYNEASFPVLRSLGLEFTCDITSKKKVEIGYQIGTSAEYFTPDLRWNYENNIRRFNQAGKVVWENTLAPAPAGGNNASCLFDSYVSTGCGFIRIRTHKYENNLGTSRNLQGYIIGLSKTNISNLKPADITDDMISYGIAVTCNLANDRKYNTMIDGVYKESGVNPNFIGLGDTNNDFQEVIINFDKIEFNVYQNGTQTKIPLTAPENYTAGEKLYPFFIFRNTNVSFNSLRVTPSPYGAVTDNVNNVVELGSPPANPKNNGDNVLTFKAQSLADFLGYQNVRQPQIGVISAVEHSFIAGLAFKPTDIADAFLVELLNLKCESYDGLRNQRKNLLAVIPKSNATGEVIYEVNTPFFIDLNNAKDILLRNIKLRIVLPDYSEISMLGTATLVLLLDS